MGVRTGQCNLVFAVELVEACPEFMGGRDARLEVGGHDIRLAGAGWICLGPAPTEESRIQDVFGIT